MKSIYHSVATALFKSDTVKKKKFKVRNVNNFGDLCVGLAELLNFGELTTIDDGKMSKVIKVNILFESIFHVDFLEPSFSDKLLNLSQVISITINLNFLYKFMPLSSCL